VDFADTRCRVIERGIVAHHAEFSGVDFDLAKVGGADGAVGDRGLRSFFPGAIVGDGERPRGAWQSLLVFFSWVVDDGESIP